MNRINLGNAHIRIEAVGADEAIEKMNIVSTKIKEVQELLLELSKTQVYIDFKQDEELSAD